MTLTAAQRRERRATQRSKDAEGQSSRGQRKPPGREPAGCYWDPRPGEPTSLFAMLTMEGYPTAAILKDPELYDDKFSLFEYMKQDFIQQDRSQAEASNLCLLDLDHRLNQMGKSMDVFFDDEWCSKETKTELQRELLKYSDAREQRAICDGLPLDTKPGRAST